MASESDSQPQAAEDVPPKPTEDLEAIRERQRQRWQQQKDAEATASASSSTQQPAEPAEPGPASGYPSSSSAAPAAAPAAASAASASSESEGKPEAPTTLKRLHILPFAEADRKIGGRSRMDVIGPELRRMREEQQILSAGALIRHDGLDFAVTNCDPAEGHLGIDTDYFFDGPPLINFDKIQFSCWGPNDMTADELFSECIEPFFKGDYRAYGVSDAKKVRTFHLDEVFKIGEVSFHVEATEPDGPYLGVVTNVTEIFANWDSQAEFEKIHIVPFQDTLPRAYDYDIFNDYLRPYLDGNKHKKMQCNELFTWQGVQFKVVACHPPECQPARIGKGTTIFCEGVLHPSLRNLLPPELLHQVSQLPPGLQMLLLNTERTTRELEDMLTHRRGLFEDTLTQVESFDWPPPAGDANTQTTCMVCLAEFEDGEPCRRLPCRHVFHTGCVDEWLRRCTDCPICKANVDRAIRNY